MIHPSPIKRRVSRRIMVGPVPVGGRKLAAYFEAHIEQGPVLEDEDMARTIYSMGTSLLTWVQRLHAAGLFETDGRLVAVREDVGRHNAIDKLIGSRVRAREIPLWDRILMVSGRVSFEIVQKAAVAGLPIICAVSAPSDLAVHLADRLGVTLIGFLRGGSFTVYNGRHRIKGD